MHVIGTGLPSVGHRSVVEAIAFVFIQRLNDDDRQIRFKYIYIQTLRQARLIAIVVVTITINIVENFDSIGAKVQNDLHELLIKAHKFLHIFNFDCRLGVSVSSASAECRNMKLEAKCGQWSMFGISLFPTLSAIFQHFKN